MKHKETDVLEDELLTEKGADCTTLHVLGF